MWHQFLLLFWVQSFSTITVHQYLFCPSIHTDNHSFISSLGIFLCVGLISCTWFTWCPLLGFNSIVTFVGSWRKEQIEPYLQGGKVTIVTMVSLAFKIKLSYVYKQSKLQMNVLTLHKVALCMCLFCLFVFHHHLKLFCHPSALCS